MERGGPFCFTSTETIRLIREREQGGGGVWRGGTILLYVHRNYKAY